MLAVGPEVAVVVVGRIRAGLQRAQRQLLLQGAGQGREQRDHEPARIAQVVLADPIVEPWGRDPRMRRSGQDARGLLADPDADQIVVGVEQADE
ncbi:hypothetical protein WJ968_33240 [Achromobacter xylosoxidans]